MLSKKRTSPTRSLAFRLTLMYAAICVLMLGGVLAVSYFVLQSALQRSLDQGLVNEIWEYGSLLQEQDMDVMRDVLDREAVSEGTDRMFFRILDTRGKEIFATDMSAWHGVDVKLRHVAAAAEGKTVFDTGLAPGGVHEARVVYGRMAPGLILQLGESIASNAEMLAHFRYIFGVATAVLVLCSVPVGWLMARRALEGVQRVTEAANSIASGAWESRVPESHKGDEIDELAAAFNEMAEHIQTLIKELKEVTDDIAHDLRTPITRMRAAAEVVLRETGDARQRDQLAGSIMEECDRLLVLINTMLEISQTEAGAYAMSSERLDLCAVVENVCDLFHPAAEDKGIALLTEFARGLIIEGEPARLPRAIGHVLDNALKYTPHDGRVTVTCSKKGRMACVSIADTGAGIPEADLERIFARFFRGDKSRSEDGHGLGLSLARAICRAHGGDLTATSEPGKGSVFEVSLPSAKD